MAEKFGLNGSRVRRRVLFYFILSLKNLRIRQKNGHISLFNHLIYNIFMMLSYNQAMKMLLVIVWLVILSLSVGALFWYNEWVYHLPTPIPADYKPVAQGTRINLQWPKGSNPDKPLFLHFFNPDCPCSRFNVVTFRSLVGEYGGRINFAVVVMNNKRYSSEEIQKKLNLKLPVLFDQSVAAACGVYSMRQAVLIDTQRELCYRGNYNRSRYCTDEQTNYARMAIKGLLNDHTNLSFDRLALRSYGCTLPNCKK